MKTGYIYRYTHIASGKMYIGQTWDLYNRRKSHKTCIDSTAFHNAFQKYGADAFTFDVICTSADQATLDTLETCYIQVLDTLRPNGYNLKTGGRGGKHSDESKHLMSQANKGKPAWNKGKQHSPETLERIKQSLNRPEVQKKLSENNAMNCPHNRAKVSQALKGRTFTDEWKHKISNAKKGKRPHKQSSPLQLKLF